MKNLCNRRSFLKSTSLVPLAAGALGLGPLSALAIEPVKRVGGSSVKPALNVYSFNSLLRAGGKNGANGTTMLALLDFCAEHGLEGIDATGYYFDGYPEAPSDSQLFEFKRRAFDLGIGIV